MTEMGMVDIASILRDFEEASDHESGTGENVEKAATPPVVTLHPDELETIRNEQYRAGIRDGSEQMRKTMLEQQRDVMGKVLDSILSEQDFLKEYAGSLSKMFLDALERTLGELLPSIEEKGIFHRVLKDDVDALISPLEGDITVTCAPDLKESLKPLEEEREAVIVQEDVALEPGAIIVKSTEGFDIALAHQEWQKSVRKKIMDAVSSLIGNMKHDGGDKA